MNQKHLDWNLKTSVLANFYLSLFPQYADIWEAVL